MSELDNLTFKTHTIELSVQSHYLLSALTLLHKIVNFFTNVFMQEITIMIKQQDCQSQLHKKTFWPEHVGVYTQLIYH